MSVFEFRHPDGRRIEREYPIGKAPGWIRVDGRRCERVPSLPARVCMDGFSRGEKPSVSRQLPQWYGYRDRDGAYRDWLNARGVDYSEERKRACVRAGIGPTPAEQNERAKRNAIRAGAVGEFTKAGKPKATTKRGEWNHVARGRAMGDSIGVDR